MNLSDVEISKALALAIGWREDQLVHSSATQRLYVFPTETTTVSQSKFFDYRDWNVIGPIATKYGCFPTKGRGAFGETYWWTQLEDTSEVFADTPQKAIALAVIGALK